MPAFEAFADLLGEPERLSIAKSDRVLGWQPRPVADTMPATAESLSRLPGR